MAMKILSVGMSSDTEAYVEIVQAEHPYTEIEKVPLTRRELARLVQKAASVLAYMD